MMEVALVAVESVGVIDVGGLAEGKAVAQSNVPDSGRVAGVNPVGVADLHWICKKGECEKKMTKPQ